MSMRVRVFVNKVVWISVILLLPGCGNPQNDKAKKTTDERRQLFLTAVSGLPSERIVHQIATPRDAESVRLLTLIANAAQADFGTRKAAIGELGKNGSPDALEGVAELLAPHRGVALRLDAARALANSPCANRCIKAILFYLYRISSGEVAVQDQEIVDRRRKILEEDQKELITDLNNVLLQHKSDILQALTANYGLGSDGPSPFSLEMIERLHLRESCDLLSSRSSTNRR